MNKKLTILIIVLICLFFIYLISYLSPKNYKIDYKYNDISISEEYKKDKKLYILTLKNKKVEYIFNISHNYVPKRKLVLKVIINGDCVTIKNKILDEKSICKKSNNYQSIFYDENLLYKEIDKFQNISIYDYDDKKYFIWNYNNFVVLSNDKKENLSLFSKDIYNFDLAIQIKDDLLIADYDQKYNFKQMYLINSQSLKIKTILLDKKIYYNSYFLGLYKNDIYVYDIQEKQEYKINPYKEKQEKVSNKVLINNKWQEISENKLQKEKIYFQNQVNKKYYILDDKLIYKDYDIDIEVTNKNVSKIIYSDEENCYFISNDVLYKVNINTGIKPLLKFTEWKFNNKNIYIF